MKNYWMSIIYSEKKTLDEFTQSDEHEECTSTEDLLSRSGNGINFNFTFD